MPTCLCCEKDYDQELSTASEANNKYYCTNVCEKSDEQWLTEANKIMDSAKAENPQLFLRTSMTKEQNEALSSIKKMGLNFRNEDIANMVPGDENA